MTALPVAGDNISTGPVVLAPAFGKRLQFSVVTPLCNQLANKALRRAMDEMGMDIAFFGPAFDSILRRTGCRERKAQHHTDGTLQAFAGVAAGQAERPRDQRDLLAIDIPANIGNSGACVGPDRHKVR